MQVEKTSLADVLVVTPKRFGDHRGWFCETYNGPQLATAGVPLTFVQDNHSMSAQAGTLRGLHCQRPPHAQAKLVRCSRGAIFDVAVDIRCGSPQFGQWFGVTISAQNGKQLLVPVGFLHGFVTLTPDCEVQYKCTDVYVPATEIGIRWDDPSIGIDWGLDTTPTLSGKDQDAMLLADFETPFDWVPA